MKKTNRPQSPYARNRPGPALCSFSPAPMNSPVPIAPPMPIIWICRFPSPLW
ncbi:hypothetical protein HMPREF9336_04219 [Segniliparus rugosus ATCC BAA-974]|uniref:Uncharacterized protein n=1 Tax=Segniliparus rugosus (strain ATCC BAA-974 / DSM 45345 / CCUG 50838 / CIP 108380 / JCM 13579 / CDC 945) TaxID=679197 RepID=U1N946_SEGRC|nr:hypothetical protein HMPREF9336_04219 [Segniliparus rugosus ATCC BAA-974]